MYIIGECGDGCFKKCGFLSDLDLYSLGDGGEWGGIMFGDGVFLILIGFVVFNVKGRFGVLVGMEILLIEIGEDFGDDFGWVMFFKGEGILIVEFSFCNVLGCIGMVVDCEIWDWEVMVGGVCLLDDWVVFLGRFDVKGGR